MAKCIPSMENVEISFPKGKLRRSNDNCWLDCSFAVGISRLPVGCPHRMCPFQWTLGSTGCSERLDRKPICHGSAQHQLQPTPRPLHVNWWCPYVQLVLQCTGCSPQSRSKQCIPERCHSQGQNWHRPRTVHAFRTSLVVLPHRFLAQLLACRCAWGLLVEHKRRPSLKQSMEYILEYLFSIN